MCIYVRESAGDCKLPAPSRRNHGSHGLLIGSSVSMYQQPGWLCWLLLPILEESSEYAVFLRLVLPAAARFLRGLARSPLGHTESKALESLAMRSSRWVFQAHRLSHLVPIAATWGRADDPPPTPPTHTPTSSVLAGPSACSLSFLQTITPHRFFLGHLLSSEAII